jgi:hypothetical protein
MFRSDTAPLYALIIIVIAALLTLSGCYFVL